MLYENERKQPSESMSASEAGRMGGEAVVDKYGPEHMADIGRKGGEAVSQDREHMADIGRKGGEAGSAQSSSSARNRSESENEE